MYKRDCVTFLNTVRQKKCVQVMMAYVSTHKAIIHSINDLCFVAYNLTVNQNQEKILIGRSLPDKPRGNGKEFAAAIGTSCHRFSEV